MQQQTRATFTPLRQNCEDIEIKNNYSVYCFVTSLFHPKITMRVEAFKNIIKKQAILVIKRIPQFLELFFIIEATLLEHGIYMKTEL